MTRARGVECWKVLAGSISRYTDALCFLMPSSARVGNKCRLDPPRLLVFAECPGSISLPRRRPPRAENTVSSELHASGAALTVRPSSMRSADTSMPTNDSTLVQGPGGSSCCARLTILRTSVSAAYTASDKHSYSDTMRDIHSARYCRSSYYPLGQRRR